MLRQLTLMRHIIRTCRWARVWALRGAM
jgi:hypothetical protein